MELPQSRAFGATQARQATHDFLSLYTHHPSLHQDPRSSHAAGSLLKTHNFLQPLEGEKKSSSKEDNMVDINVKPQPATLPNSVVEHVLPGGIGTYSISHISYINPRVPKPEDNMFSVGPVTSNDKNEDNSNCSSYTGSGFSLWDESATRKGNSGKDNLGDVNVVKEQTMKMGQWAAQSSSNYCTSVGPLSSSQALGQKNQSFMEMIKSAKGPHSMEEEVEEDSSLKKESSSSQKGELRVKVGGKSSDQKATTPRSKHSATEQRRRCKINDRFQMLREIIPHSDQKRDKASFLLEVIEYIQYLQEKVNRYEGSYPGWNNEATKLNPWRNSHGGSEPFIDQSRVVNGIASPVLMFGPKLDDKSTLHVPRNPHHPNMTNTINVKAVDQQGITNNTGPISSPLQPDINVPIPTSSAIAQLPTRLPSEGPTTSFPHLHLWQSRVSGLEPSIASDKLKDQELALEGGTINISSMYSQGLLTTLTRALQSSGVDLTQASISVQVDIGKRANNRQSTQEGGEKGAEAPSGSKPLLHPRVESTINESDHAVKRLKTG